MLFCVLCSYTCRVKSNSFCFYVTHTSSVLYEHTLDTNMFTTGLRREHHVLYEHTLDTNMFTTVCWFEKRAPCTV